MARVRLVDQCAAHHMRVLLLCLSLVSDIGLGTTWLTLTHMSRSFHSRQTKVSFIVAEESGMIGLTYICVPPGCQHSHHMAKAQQLQGRVNTWKWLLPCHFLRRRLLARLKCRSRCQKLQCDFQHRQKMLMPPRCYLPLAWMAACSQCLRMSDATDCRHALLPSNITPLSQE